MSHHLKITFAHLPSAIKFNYTIILFIVSYVLRKKNKMTCTVAVNSSLIQELGSNFPCSNFKWIL